MAEATQVVAPGFQGRGSGTPQERRPVMISFTIIGILAVAVWAALLTWLLVTRAGGAIRRIRRRRQIDREIATAIRGLTDEEVASWLS